MKMQLLCQCTSSVAIVDCSTAQLQAEQYIEANKDLSASHNCFAYKLGQKQRATDDGEPSGTAGQPILSAINAEQLNGVCVLVTRCGQSHTTHVYHREAAC